MGQAQTNEVNNKNPIGNKPFSMVNSQLNLNSGCGDAQAKNFNNIFLPI